MSRPKGRRKQARISVSFEDSDYATLHALAHRRDVSVAWLVRQAVHGLLKRETAEWDNLELPLIPRAHKPDQVRT